MMNFDAEVSQMMADMHAPDPRRSGTLVRSVGMRLETRGLMAPLGACCEVLDPTGHRVEAEVVGFNDDTLYLMPFTEPNGIGPGARVTVLSHSSNVNLGPDLLGRIIDGRGQPLDGKPVPDTGRRVYVRGGGAMAVEPKFVPVFDITACNLFLNLLVKQLGII